MYTSIHTGLRNHTSQYMLEETSNVIEEIGSGKVVRNPNKV